MATRDDPRRQVSGVNDAASGHAPGAERAAAGRVGSSDGAPHDRPDAETAAQATLHPIAGGAGPAEVDASPAGHLRRQIAGFEILGLAGRGGMGVVYKARHVALNRLVAIKMIRSAEDASAEELMRFRIEAETVAQLQHPNIVQIFQIGEQDGIPYLALEYVDGGNLASKIQGKPQPIADSVALLERIALAVHEAHGRGIIHRDLKPANVLLTADGTPKITDFGLARHADRVAHSTSSHIEGTASYMAPEQAWGPSRLQPVGPATDVYALGAILYEMLSGRPPFKAGSVHETLEQVWTKDPISLERLRPDVPPDLAIICHQCLRKDPRHRYASTKDLADDLRRFRSREPITARPVGRVERAILWCRRNPWPATLACVLFAGLFGGTGGFAVVNYRHAEENYTNLEEQRRLRYKAEALAESETNLRHKAETSERLAREKAALFYSFLIVSAERAIEAGNAAEAVRTLGECPPEARNAEWFLRNRQLQGSELTLAVGGSDKVTDAVYSPDGRVIVSSSAHGPVRLWDRARGRLLGTLAGPARAVAFLPDGNRLLVMTQRYLTVSRRDGTRLEIPESISELEVWDVRERRRIKVLADGVACFALSADGKRLAIGRRFVDTVDVIDIESGDRVANVSGHAGELYAVAFTPDGRRLVSASRVPQNPLPRDFAPRSPRFIKPSDQRPAEGENDLLVWDLESNELLTVVEGTPERVFGAIAVAPDGRRVAVRLGAPDARAAAGENRDAATATWDDEVALYDLATGRPSAPNEQANAKIAAPSDPKLTVGPRTPPGDDSAEESRKGPAAVPSRSAAVREAAPAVHSAAFSPDGALLVLIDGPDLRIFDARSGVLLRTLTGHTANAQTVYFSHDGRHLLTAGGADGTVKVWDVNRTAGAPREFATRPDVRSRQEHNVQVAFSSDGRLAAIVAEDGTIAIYDVKTSRLRMTVPRVDASPSPVFAEADARQPLGAKLAPTRMTFHDGDRRLTAIYGERLVCRWDLRGDEPKREDLFDEQGLQPYAWRQWTRLRISPDGQYLASWYSRDQNMRVDVWHIASRKKVLVREKPADLDFDSEIYFSDRDPCLVLVKFPKAIDSTISTYDLRTGKPLESGRAFSPFSPGVRNGGGSRYLEVDEQGHVTLNDARRNRVLITLRGKSDYQYAIFSPDGRWVAAIARDRVDVYDASPPNGPDDPATADR